MKTQNINRGNETEEHRALKAQTLQSLKRFGYGLVLCEKQNCDVIAIRPRSATMLGVEIERSIRNLMANIFRDFSVGCFSVLVVCPNFKINGEIARKLDRELPTDLREKVGVATSSALRMIAPTQP